MKKLLIILAIFAITLTSCFKERKCDKIREEWTTDYMIHYEKLTSLEKSMIQCADVWGYDSKQYKALLAEFQKETDELNKTNQNYVNEMRDADCPDCSIPNI